MAIFNSKLLVRGLQIVGSMLDADGQRVLWLSISSGTSKKLGQTNQQDAVNVRSIRTNMCCSRFFFGA